MNVPSINALKPSAIIRKLSPKKQVNIPLELEYNIHKKLSAHQRALDYLASRYKVDFGFAASPSGKGAYVVCSKKNRKLDSHVWSKTEILTNERFEESARKIYKLTDDVLELYNC